MLIAQLAQSQFSGGVGDGHSAVLLKNKLPVGNNFSISLAENEDYWFKASDFVFSDGDGYFKAIKITSLESDGDLENRNENVLINDTISDLGLLHFKTLFNEYGWPYAQFKFQLVDNENGLSVEHYTCTIYVIHNPIGNSLVTSVNEDDTLNIPADFFAAVYGQNRSFKSITIKSLPTKSKLFYNKQEASINTAYTDASAFQFIAPPDSTGLLFDEFSFQLTDNENHNSDSVYFFRIHVKATDDTPLSQNTQITVLEDNKYIFASQVFSFSDVDLGASFGGIIISNIAGNGTLANANEIVSNGDTIRSINELSYFASENLYGNYFDEFYFKVLDNTNLSSVFTYVCRIHVLPVNDAPTSADTSITTSEDQSYVFGINNFVFNDIDSKSPGILRIVSLPPKGSLKYNNALITQPMNISNYSLLSYSPPANQFGQNFTSFTFCLLDDSLAKSEIHTLSIDVNEINDLPVAQNFTKYVTEDLPYYFNKSDFKYADAETDSLFGFIFDNLPAKGKLLSFGNPISGNTLYAVKDSVYFVSEQNDFGSYYASIPVKMVDARMGISLLSYTAQFHVDAAPDAPYSETVHLSFFEDSLQAFTKSQIPFYDADGQSLFALTFDSLPKNGIITYENKEISSGEIYTDFALLKYLGNKDLNGTGIDYLYARVIDKTLLASVLAYKYMIDIMPVNDAPHAIFLSENHIGESMPIASTIGTLTAEDIDSEMFEFALTESNDLSDIDNDYFVIEGNELKTGISLDYENQYLYFIRIGAIDDEDAIFSMGFMIYVDNEAENKVGQLTSGLRFFPNPASDYIQFEIDRNAPISYRIINIQGNKVLEGKLETENRISVSELKKGFYLLQIVSDAKFYQFKLIKE